MNIKEITLSMSEIVPKGDFSNVRPHMSITWGIDMDDITSEGVDKVFNDAQKELKDRFNAWLPFVINKVKHEETQKANVEAEPKIKTQPCIVPDCTYDRFYRNDKNGKVWYSHKGKDGSYHNLK